MSLSIKDLAAQFAKQNNTEGSGNNRYYPFFNMKIDERAVVRFLPDADKDNPLGFLLAKHSHTFLIAGKKVTIPCLRQYGEKCEACDLAQKYYKAGDKVMGKLFWRNESHLAQVLVKEDPIPVEAGGESPVGKVKLVNMGYQLFQVITQAIKSGDLDELPYDYENGCDFIITKTKQGEHGVYNVGSKFARKVSALTPDEIVLADASLVSLKSTLPAKPEASKMRELCAQVLDPSLIPEDGAEDDTGGDETPVTSSAAPALRQTVREDAPRVEAKASASTAETNSKAQDILSKIRERNAAKK